MNTMVFLFIYFVIIIRVFDLGHTAHITGVSQSTKSLVYCVNVFVANMQNFRRTIHQHNWAHKFQLIKSSLICNKLKKTLAIKLTI